jgi:hypothetical protein
MERLYDGDQDVFDVILGTTLEGSTVIGMHLEFLIQKSGPLKHRRGLWR